MTYGLQMISILFRSKTMARYSNLIGIDKYDLYTEVSADYKNQYETLFQCYDLLHYDANRYEGNNISILDETLFNRIITDRYQVLNAFFKTDISQSLIIIKVLQYLNDSFQSSL